MLLVCHAKAIYIYYLDILVVTIIINRLLVFIETKCYQVFDKLSNITPIRRAHQQNSRYTVYCTTYMNDHFNNQVSAPGTTAFYGHNDKSDLIIRILAKGKMAMPVSIVVDNIYTKRFILGSLSRSTNEQTGNVTC